MNLEREAAVAPLPWQGGLSPEVRDHLVAMSAELQLRLSEYFALVKVPPGRILRVDLAVALLRINTEESLSCAQELTGCAITKCPSALPPWPPIPVRPSRGLGTVTLLVSYNPCREKTDCHRRFGQVRTGLTKEQLKARGVTQRDIERWIKKKWIEVKR